jgi:polyhydroxyalkanoate synthesis regulator phasin
MAQGPDWMDWQRFLEVGQEFTAMTRTEARRRAKELVREGQLAQERVQTFVDELVRTSRQRADELVEVVRKEIQRQMEALGIATKDDLKRLEARLRKTEKASRSTKAAKAAPRKPPAKRKKAPAKKAASKRPSRAS